MQRDDDPVEPILRRARERGRPSILREFLAFLLHSKKWWLAPILLLMAAMAWLAVSAGGALPFIYAF